MTLALVHVRLAARSRKALRTIARKRAGRIHANAVVLARQSLFAFVNVLTAIGALVTAGARTRKRTVNGTGIAQGIRVARIRCARIVQMAQQSGFAFGAATIETAHAIDACRSVEAGRRKAIVNVFTAIGARPAVDANASVAAVRIRAGCTVLADRRSGGAFVNVIFAVLADVVGIALAAIRIDPINTDAAILT